MEFANQAAFVSSLGDRLFVACVLMDSEVEGKTAVGRFSRPLARGVPVHRPLPQPVGSERNFGGGGWTRTNDLQIMSWLTVVGATWYQRVSLASTG